MNFQLKMQNNAEIAPEKCEFADSQPPLSDLKYSVASPSMSIFACMIALIDAFEIVWFGS